MRASFVLLLIAPAWALAPAPAAGSAPGSAPSAARGAAATAAPSAGAPREPARRDPRVREAFERLARRGEPAGLLWCIEHFRAALGIGSRPLLPEERTARLALFQDLIARASAGLLERELPELLGREGDLSPEDVRWLVELLERTATAVEPRAGALLVQARRAAAAGLRADALALYDEVLRRYPGTRAAGQAGVERWRLEHLALGSTAPDFTTYDAVGNEIRLEDYRGRVVVVRFWGFGHGRAADQAAQLDQVADMVRRHWDDRFTWIGVSDDPGREAFRLACERHGVSGTQAWEGNAQGGANRAWRMDRRDATYVLDAAGVVRAVDPDPRTLERLVQELLAELRADIDVRERKLAAGASPHR